MDTVRTNAKRRNSDPLVDEVRENRRKLVTAFGGDLDRLADHLRQVQADYENRTGAYADLPRKNDDEMFPSMTGPVEDGVRNEVQSLRVAPPRKPRARRRK